MKRCPVCDRTFDDSMKFCQIDGTPLVVIDESDQPFDSFKTMVGSPVSVEENASESSDDSSARTQILTPEEMDREMNVNNVKDETIKDDSLPSPLDSTTHSWMDSPDKIADEYPPSSSPFDESRSSGYSSPSTPFQEPEPMFGKQDSFNQSAYGSQDQSYNQPFQQTEWTPPPAPVSEWQNQNLGVNTAFQTPVGLQGDNKTLAIVSLVCGILSVTCCGAVTGIAALITGFMAKNNIDANPQQYGGRGMATAGMILGGISIVLTILYFVFVVIGGVFR